MPTQLSIHTAFFQSNGYVIVKNLFSPEECTHLIQHYMTLRAQGEKPFDFAGVDPSQFDPLKKYPRMIHMHRWDQTSLNFLLDARLNQHLTAFLNAEPLACQTMLYFKPPGARGQALHQDNFYLKAAPGSCCAAWLALDPCDTSNGCMQVVPQSHKWGLLCTKKADTTQSFTDVEVPLPRHAAPIPCLMNPGDVLFFNGELIHGSYPNTSTTRFRRSLIAHYIESSCTRVTDYDQPVLKMNGSPIDLEPSPSGGPCGTWVNTPGSQILEFSTPDPNPLQSEPVA